MKRRTLIKSGIVAACAAFIGAGIHKNENKESIITPKQTKPYEISAPMPFNYNLIDEIKKLNSTLKKVQVKTFYNNIPYPFFAKFGGNFQGFKGTNSEIKSFEDFAQYVKYAKKAGFKFVYILNSPKPFFEEEFNKYSKELFNLIDRLEEIGCDEFKIANQQLIKIISEKRPHLTLAASTSFEFHNVSQFMNLLETYPQIKCINISIDDNKNFLFLKNLRKAFPDVKIELLLNEGCFHGCPSRICHAVSYYEHWDCKKLADKIGGIKTLLKSNVIYPWWLPYYQSIGINSFKLFSVTARANISKIDTLKSYLKCIEYGTKNVTVNEFFNKILYSWLRHTNIKHRIMLSEIMPYLPQIEHFIKNGHKCADICGIECNYCIKNAEKIEKIIGV